MQTNHVIFNGKLIPESQAQLSISDLAIVRGYGIFDFFKTVNGRPIFIEDNLDRFYQSASLMDLPVSYTRQELKDFVYQLMAVNNMPDSGIKLLLTGGYSSDGYSIAQPNFIVSQQPVKRNVSMEQQGMKLLPFDYQRPFSQIKSIDYVMGIQAMKQAKLRGADDVLYMQNGLISECPRANFFLVSPEDKLLTAADHVLEGITRKKILELAAPEIEVELRPVTLEDVREAKEAFISSTTKNITAVSSILGYKEMSSVPGPITKHLQYLLQELVYSNS